MSTLPYPDRRVLRNPTTLRNLAVLVPTLIALGLWTGTTPGLWFGGAALIALAGAWPRVIVDGGVTVVNVLPRRLAWQDIASVQCRQMRASTAGLCFLLVDGTRIWGWGVLTNGFGSEWTAATCQEIEARHADSRRSER